MSGILYFLLICKYGASEGDWKHCVCGPLEGGLTGQFIGWISDVNNFSCFSLGPIRFPRAGRSNVLPEGINPTVSVMGTEWEKFLVSQHLPVFTSSPCFKCGNPPLIVPVVFASRDLFYPTWRTRLFQLVREGGWGNWWVEMLESEIWRLLKNLL